MSQQVIAAAAAAATMGLVPKVKQLGALSAPVKVGIGVAGWYFGRKLEGPTGAIVIGASVGLAIDGLLDLVPGLSK